MAVLHNPERKYEDNKKCRNLPVVLLFLKPECVKFRNPLPMLLPPSLIFIIHRNAILLQCCLCLKIHTLRGNSLKDYNSMKSKSYTYLGKESHHILEIYKQIQQVMSRRYHM